MRKALITGILGQDGTYLARWLIAKDYEVHGMIRLPFSREEERIRRRFTSEDLARLHFHTAALEDPFSLAGLLRNSSPDEVYHLAGLSDSRQSFLVPEQTVQSITVGTLRILEAGRFQNPAIRYFLASSCEIFGAPGHSPQREDTPRQPLTPYGIAKQAADNFARLYREKFNQFISVGILYNHESPLRPPNYLSRRVARAIAAIKKKKLQKLRLGDLQAQRDWCDARDVTQGFWLALQAEHPDDFIFSSGASRTVREFVEVAFAAAGLEAEAYIETDPASVPSSVTVGLCGDCAKAEKILGWKRRWDFSGMVGDLVQAELEDRPEIERANPHSSATVSGLRFGRLAGGAADP
ncbi:MAG TPA: GDP-mannose 4,6-dehydratase [Candidatus Saccharimonadales bacterium]|nr:GDP-mannose 4,6-dehydratase [Candidatus Saccharimonadales bacterium]